MNPRAVLMRSGVRYMAVGGVCALAHNLVMIGGAALGLHYLVSAVFSFALVVLVGYGLHAAVTFGQRFSLSAFGRYALAMAGNYPLTIALLFVFCDLLHAPMAVASPVATVVLMAWNYLTSRWAIARNLAPAHAQDAAP